MYMYMYVIYIAGKMAQLLVKHLMARGPRSITVVNRGQVSFDTVLGLF